MTAWLSTRFLWPIDPDACLKGYRGTWPHRYAALYVPSEATAQLFETHTIPHSLRDSRISGNMQNRISGNPDIRISGYQYFRISEYPDIRSSGYPDIGISGYLEIRMSGYQDMDIRIWEIRISGYRDIRASGYPDIRTLRNPEIRISGFPDQSNFNEPVLHHSHLNELVLHPDGHVLTS